MVWKTKDGTKIPIKDLSDEHLNNILNLISRKMEEYFEHLEALGSLGEMEIL